MPEIPEIPEIEKKGKDLSGPPLSSLDAQNEIRARREKGGG